jgi:hypothetical protein
MLIHIPDGPWLFSRAILDGSTGQTLVERARRRPKYPAGPRPPQQDLLSSIT